MCGRWGACERVRLCCKRIAVYMCYVATHHARPARLLCPPRPLLVVVIAAVTRPPSVQSAAAVGRALTSACRTAAARHPPRTGPRRRTAPPAACRRPPAASSSGPASTSAAARLKHVNGRRGVTHSAGTGHCTRGGGGGGGGGDIRRPRGGYRRHVVGDMLAEKTACVLTWPQIMKRSLE